MGAFVFPLLNVSESLIERRCSNSIPSLRATFLMFEPLQLYNFPISS